MYFLKLYNLSFIDGGINDFLGGGGGKDYFSGVMVLYGIIYM